MTDADARPLTRREAERLLELLARLSEQNGVNGEEREYIARIRHRLEELYDG